MARESWIWAQAEDGRCEYAVALGDEGTPPIDLELALAAAAGQAPPALCLSGAPPGATLEVAETAPGSYSVRVGIPALPPGEQDDALLLQLTSSHDGPPPLSIELRRTHSEIQWGLLGRDAAGSLPDEQTRAAILWHGWRRFSRVVGLRQFTGGFSESHVLLAQPQLKLDGRLAHAAPVEQQVVARSWGVPLLIKTGPADSIRKEWRAYRELAQDRAHPFMARIDACVEALPASPPIAERKASLISSFLGGTDLRVETVESVIRGPSSLERVRRVVERTFEVSRSWYEGAVTAPFGEWRRMFETEQTDACPLKLRRLCKVDLADAAQRASYSRTLGWEVSFAKSAHLCKFLQEGSPSFLQQLIHAPVRFSLIHGDLHPRNILADESNVWLLDWSWTGIGPTLYDFAALEAYARLWCLDLTADSESVARAAGELEGLLLDYFIGAEGSLERIGALADGLGADREQLARLVTAIVTVRRMALPYCGADPDHRDYLAVLLGTVLELLRFANPAEVRNFRVLMALYWTLEDALCHIWGRSTYARHSAAVQPVDLLAAAWVDAPGLPQRALYFLQRPEGAAALAPLAAARGVLQGEHHHLDVLDHTLLMLAYLERLLDEGLGAFLDPLRLDDLVHAGLAEQGLRLPRPAEQLTRYAEPVADWARDLATELAQALNPWTRQESSRLLKWAALYHDVGKAAVRAATLPHAREPSAVRPRRKVQFIGHEPYSVRLAAPVLQALFPEHQERRTVELLILNHHRHHADLEKFRNADPRELLQKRNAARRTSAKREVDAMYPLLLLHGFADSLACRGSAARMPLQRVAELDLALLASYFTSCGQ